MFDTWNTNQILMTYHRPEAIESVFYMYRITGDMKWREKGWRMFQATEAATKTNFGSSAIEDVTSETPFKLDSMESFWVGFKSDFTFLTKRLLMYVQLAETLKYYYLLFSDEDTVSLDDYVL